MMQHIGTYGDPINDTMESYIIKDFDSGHFACFSDGWYDLNRAYGCYAHIEVRKTGKVWLHYDGTEFRIAKLLEDKGIPKSDIVLAFRAPEVRPDTGYAIK